MRYTIVALWLLSICRSHPLDYLFYRWCYACFKNLLEFHWIHSSPNLWHVPGASGCNTPPKHDRSMFGSMTLPWRLHWIGCKSVGIIITRLYISSNYLAANIMEETEVRQGEIVSKWLKYKWASNTSDDWPTVLIYFVPVTFNWIIKLPLKEMHQTGLNHIYVLVKNCIFQ